jgi:Rrf2 family transcriptional regulator, nitric oxide-sensitive transcriptional repressor
MESEPGEGAISTAQLAEQVGVPYRFLRKIVFKLAGCGILRSRRGKGGGLSLARSPEKISLFDLLAIMEPDSVVLNKCLADEVPSCARHAYCGLHGVLGRIQVALQGQLAGVFVADMVAGERLAGAPV